MAGQFNGTIALGPTILTAIQTNPEATMPADVFIAKLDANNNYLWAIQLGDNQAASTASMAVDNTGDVYLTGAFFGYSQTFGINGPTLYNASNQNDGFIAKFSGATGQTVWARRVGGTGNDGIGALAINATGDIYALAGGSSSSIDIGPFNFTTAIGGGKFLTKLDAAGTWLWARPVASGQLSISGLLVDAQGGIYLSGAVRPPGATLGNTALTTQRVPGGSNLGVDVVVAKTNDAGNWLWVVQGDGVTQQNIVHGGLLTNDNNGHLYLAGTYEGMAARLGSTTLPNLSSPVPPPNPLPPTPCTNCYYSDAYVARLNATTGAWEWAVRNGNALDEYISAIAADSQGRVYVSGNFDKTTWPSTEQSSLAQLDGANGAWRSVQSITGSFQNLHLDSQNALHVVGSRYDGPLQLGSFSLPSAGPGRSTGFLARLAAGPLATRPATAPAWLQVWPNPANAGLVRVLGPTPGALVEVLDVLGRRLSSGHLPASGPLELRLPPTCRAGLYLVRSAGQTERLMVE